MRNKNKYNLTNFPNFLSQVGFTLVEMLVVLFILGILSTLFIANYAALRGPRNLKIAQNELVTNIRKIQSYTLSARDAPNGDPAHFYIYQFNSATPTQYSIYVIDKNTPPALTLVETIRFPQGIRLRTTNPIEVQQTGGVGSFVSKTCVQGAFALPFAKLYTDGTCAIETLAASESDLDLIDNSITNVYLEDTGSGRVVSIQINGVNGAVKAQ